MTKRVEVFQEELSTITDKRIKDFAIELLEQADSYFFETPASTTGKYHPQYALGVGGLIRHSKATVRILNHLISCECHSLSSTQEDLLRVAMLVHDIKKLGDNTRGFTVKDHPKLASDYVRDVNTKSENPLIDSLINFICECIEGHMGKWGDENFSKTATYHQKLVHMADCLASKKDLVLVFDDEELKRTNNVINAEDYIISFGKYTGKKLIEVPLSYLQWCMENVNKGSFNTMVASYLLEQSKK